MDGHHQNRISSTANRRQSHKNMTSTVLTRHTCTLTNREGDEVWQEIKSGAKKIYELSLNVRQIIEFFEVNQHTDWRKLFIIKFISNAPYVTMGVDHGKRGKEDRETNPPEFGAGGLSPQILSCCKILSTRLLALQCRKMRFLPLQQDFYSKSRHTFTSPPEFQSDIRLCM